MVTMLDVSKRAGVSKSTVSRVLSNSPRISQETKDLVYRAIQELGYRPNTLAQSLSKKRTNTIGLVIPRGASMSKFLAMLIDQCHDIVTKAGKSLLITQVVDKEDGAILAIKSMVDRRCDGILYYNNSFFDYTTNNTLLNQLVESLSIPLVVMNCKLTNHLENSVWIDNSQIAALPVKYLIENGHKKIAYISGKLSQQTAKDRLKGYEKALDEAGIDLEPLLIIEGGRTYSEGYNACQKLIERNLDISAICCFNDQVAIGVVKALQKSNIPVPEKISVFGIDNESVLEFCSIGISSVNLPIEAMTQFSVKKLLMLLGEDDVDSIDSIPPFYGELIIRESVCEIY